MSDYDTTEPLTERGARVGRGDRLFYTHRSPSGPVTEMLTSDSTYFEPTNEDDWPLGD